MPKRTDISSILIIGAGPIVIGQACEFDYSGVQACKALRAEGYRIVLVNSNPATIMTDPDVADATYIEPITPEMVEKIIAKERPDALLPTMGGQTALNTALALEASGVLAKYGVEMIGARAEVIDKAEDRAEIPRRHGRDRAWRARKSRAAHTLEEALEALEFVGLPAIIRPSFTLAGTGGGIAYNLEEFREIVERGLDLSPTNEVLIEESVLGWKEYEMEVVRDKADNCIIVCSIENIDPMGVHTGDSITVAPALTLTDKEYQRMRVGLDRGAARDRRRDRRLQRAVRGQSRRRAHGGDRDEPAGVALLGAGVQGHRLSDRQGRRAAGGRLHARRADERHHRRDARPRSSRPSTMWSPRSRASPSRSIPGAEPYLTTSMKSVGEVMAIGRTFAESLQKALRGLETGLTGLDEIEIPGADDPGDAATPRSCARWASRRPTACG